MKKYLSGMRVDAVILVLFAAFLFTGLGWLTYRMVGGEYRQPDTSSFFASNPPPKGEGNRDDITDDQGMERYLRSAAGGDVTVDIILMDPQESLTAGKLAFDVSMSTHSVDLGSIALAEHASLENSRKEVLATGIEWDLRDSTSHHPWGYLYVPLPSVDFLDDIQYVTLVLTDIAGLDDLVFTWEEDVLSF